MIDRMASVLMDVAEKDVDLRIVWNRLVFV